MVSISKSGVQIRPMTFDDLDRILAIDRRIRGAGKAISYANLTTGQVLTIDKNITYMYMAKPIRYEDLTEGKVERLFEWGLVAESEGRVRGFILGDIEQENASAPKTGVILIFGVHPDFQRKGTATALVNALLDKFHTKGIKAVRISIEQHDEELLGFFEHVGQKGNWHV